MSGSTPYSNSAGKIAETCRDAATSISEQLDRLRVHLARLDPAQLRMSSARLDALLAGYDIYARMLDDALRDIAVDLQAAPDTGRSELELAAGEPR